MIVNLKMNYSQHNESVSRVIEIEGNTYKDCYPKILYFTAKWCGPCQRIQPLYKKLADNYSEITFFKIDVDKNQELAANFNVKSMPTFFFFKSSMDYTSFSGADSVKLNDYVRLLRIKSN